MNTKHTPGPWHAYPDGSIWRIPLVDNYNYSRNEGKGVAGDHMIAKAFCGHAGWENKFQAAENASLIAAAPLLLDALLAIVAADDAQELTQEHIDAARAAIAAATN